MQRRLAHLLLTTVISAGLLASTAAAANIPIAVDGASALERTQARQAPLRGGCPTGVGLDAPAAAQESAMLCLVSEARGQFGLAPLAPSTSLRQSAVEKGGDLLRCNEFSHTACGREFSFWIRDTGYMSAECWRVGENLAWGTGEYGSVRSIFVAWMRSPTHRANVLGEFEESGLSLEVGTLEGLAGTRVWAEHFGSRC
jgi:uncharacterized protein YkwD